MVEQMPNERKMRVMTGAKGGKRVVTLRIRLTPEEYDFARFYGEEFSYGNAHDYLRVLLLQALAGEMQEERNIKARMTAHAGETDESHPPEGNSSFNLDDDIPF